MLAVGLQALKHRSHFLRRFAINAVEDKFRVSENSVQRGPKLVTHVSEKLGFVLARYLKLSAFIADFFEQAHVLDGDHRLVGECTYQLNFSLAKRSHRRPRQSEHANWIAFS